MANQMRERDYYPRVAAWARKQLGCFDTRIDAGLKLGRIDVVGLRHVGGDLSPQTEVISIEVKHGRQPFATSIGQASGYSIFADRCYLADVRSGGFSDDELAIAGRLGVGLIAISGTQRIRLTEVLTAPIGEPLDRFRLQLIDKLGYSTCTVCGSIFQRGDKENWSRHIVRQSTKRGGLERAVAADKGFAYWLSEFEAMIGSTRNQTFTRRYLCPDCVYGLFQHLDD